MTNIKIEAHTDNSDVEKKIGYLKSWGIVKELTNDVIIFIDELGRGKVNLGKQASRRTQVKYISMLRCPLMNLNKPLKKITQKDLEAFDKNLSTDVIKNAHGKPYSQNMKKDMRLALRILLKWKIGQKALELTSFFDTRDVVKTPDYLSEAEIEKLFKNCKSSHERFLIAVLFDSGARAEEFLNIRREDIRLPEGKESYVKLTLKEEYSKTTGRVVSLYWKHSLESVKDYLYERIQQGMTNNQPVFNLDYNAMRMFLRRLGVRVLKRSVAPHLFRHSSATFYASQMNRQQLCMRYGWRFSSDMPDVYIARAGVDTKELDQKFNGTELSALKDQLETEKRRADQELSTLKAQFKELVTFIRRTNNTSEGLASSVLYVNERGKDDEMKLPRLD